MSQRTGLALALIFLAYTGLILFWLRSGSDQWLDVLSLLVIGLPLAGAALWWSSRSDRPGR